MMDPKARGRALENFYKDADLTQAEAADAMHISRGTLSAWINGNSPDERVFRESIKRLGAHVGKSVAHILEGLAEGSAAESMLPYMGAVPSRIERNVVREPMRSYLHSGKDEFPQEDYFIVSVDGYSMYPELRPGDELIVKRIRGLDTSAIGGVVIAHAGDRTEIARLNVDSNGALMLRPDNPAFEPWAASGWEIDGVVATLQRKYLPAPAWK